MKISSATCRDRLTAEDFDFLAKTLAQTPSQSASLGSLLCDQETRDLILDHDAVYESLVDDTGCLRVSAALYFYVLTRRMLRQAGLEERALCDYVAGVLAAFSSTRQLEPPPPAHASATPKHFLYISDLLEALNQAPKDQVFVLRSYLGDYTLFLSGVWNEHLDARLERKGAPGIGFYESVGQSSYRMAASHPQAKQHDLQNLYEQLATDFHAIRLALNRLTENLLHLSPVNPALFLKKT